MLRIILLTVLMMIAGSARADSWALPTPKTATSHEGTYRLTIYPRDLSSQLGYFSDSVEGKDNPGQKVHGRSECFATMEKLGTDGYKEIWRRKLVNDVSPVSALVAEDGRFATFDNWHSMGYGNDAVAVYAADGALLQAYSIEQLVGKEYFEKLPRSVSSIWWSGEHSLRYDGVLQLQITDPTIAANDSEEEHFRMLYIDMKTGKVISEKEANGSGS